MSVQILTQHNNNGRSGSNLNETVLNASNVNVNQFAKLFTHHVVGQIYAQILYVPNVKIVVRGMDKGAHNVVIVATMENWVYAFDADNTSSNAEPLWGHHLDDRPAVPASIYNSQYRDIIGSIGILSTPVIDARVGASPANPTTGTIYLTLATWDPVLFQTQREKAFKQLLYALDLADGQPLRLQGRQNPVEVAGSVSGQGYLNALAPPVKGQKNANGDIVVDGQIGGKPLQIKDGDDGGANSRVVFHPMQQLQRPGLLLVQDILYFAYGSHGDFNPYHGWVFAYDAKTLEQKGVFCSTPNGGQAGIWQAGEGLVADDAGNIYAGTGNGDFRANPGGDPDLGESFIQLKLITETGAGGQPATRLALIGWVNAFIGNPGEDEDLGAASPTLLPGGRLVGGGKDGRFFLLDPAKMDRNGNPQAVTQVFNASFDTKSLQGPTHHIHGSPVVFDSPEHGPLVYVWGENEVLRAFAYNPQNGAFPNQPGPQGGQGVPIARGDSIASNDRATKDGMPGAMLSISANGKAPGTGIVWASFPPYDNANRQTVLGELRAYDASRFDSQNRLVALWSSRFHPERDHYGSFPKFCFPTIANGKVYQATFTEPGQFCVYGLLAQPNGGYNLGFGGTTGFTLNGSVRVDNTHLRLTQVPHLFLASSFFCTTPVNVAKFQTTFRFQLIAAQADGFTFTIQSEGPHALGGRGGGLGYGPDPNDPNDPGFKISRSVALKFDLFDNNTARPASTMGLYFNGESPEGGPTQAPAGIDLHSGHSFRATISYDGKTLTLALRDEVANVVANHAFAVDIPAQTGPVAHVGFTGATGGFSATQDILTWQFQS